MQLFTEIYGAEAVFLNIDALYGGSRGNVRGKGFGDGSGQQFLQGGFGQPGLIDDTAGFHRQIAAVFIDKVKGDFFVCYIGGGGFGVFRCGWRFAFFFAFFFIVLFRFFVIGQSGGFFNGFFRGGKSLFPYGGEKTADLRLKNKCQQYDEKYAGDDTFLLHEIPSNAFLYILWGSPMRYD